MVVTRAVRSKRFPLKLAVKYIRLTDAEMSENDFGLYSCQVNSRIS